MNAPGPAVSRGFSDATVDSVGFAKGIRSGRVWIFYYLLLKMEVEVAMGWVVTSRRPAGQAKIMTKVLDAANEMRTYASHDIHTIP
ncbi:hypothetical protein B5K08_17570 [Rhizobium leguminosarum bv. trifolii]|uniref:Uncharacterized protein n=1 Tax=Rhizobium leguminosarum bv. trifolii TaxID=386 RepID=A0A3E1BFF3_RHILT|nr:hypothetical protein [Rhizobium leguminosarum]RFB90748.1 hypothetical protein B5K08_17570 [Rhizobium leguminosarum bv. trifolii]RFB91121.1 hypothetical protein B5K10_17565 [Rhizobium leguminosarum bv. trifolii]